MLLLLMVALVVVSTVREGCFVESWGGLGRDDGVALLLRWGSITACRWMHRLVCLSWAYNDGQGSILIFSIRAKTF